MKNLCSLGIFIMSLLFTTQSLFAQQEHGLMQQAMAGQITYYDAVSKIDSLIEEQGNNNSTSTGNDGSTTTNNNTNTNKSLNDENEEGINVKEYHRWKNYFENKVDKSGMLTSIATAHDLMEQNFFENTCGAIEDAEWEQLGPFTSQNVGTSSLQDLGRIKIVMRHPSMHNMFFAAARTGGIYKSIDSGANWKNVTDDEYKSIFGATAFAFHPTRQNVIYAATGNDFGYGIGVIISEDYGETWSRMAGWESLNANDISDGGRIEIRDIVIDPRSNSNKTLLYAVTSGNKSTLYMMAGIGDNSQNGHWRNVGNHDIDWEGDYALITDANIEINPENQNEAWYWVDEGIFKLTKDFNVGSLSFKNDDPVTVKKNSFILSEELRSAKLSIDNDGVVYALMNIEGERWLYRHFEPTNSFFLQNSNELSTIGGGVGTRNQFEVNKENSDIMYLTNNTRLEKSTDGGQTFTQMSTSNVHDDVRSIQIAEHDENGEDVIFIGTDGGVARTFNGWNLEDFNGEGFCIAQYYGLGVADALPNHVLLGAQDGSINFYKDGQWAETNPGGDNFDAILDPRANGIVHQQANFDYTRHNLGANYSIFYPSSDNDESFDDDPDPDVVEFYGFAFAIDETNPDRLIAIWRNTAMESLDAGMTWNEITEVEKPSFYTEDDKARDVMICPSNPDIVYYAWEGSNFRNGNETEGITYYTGGIFRLERQADGNYNDPIDITNNLRELPYEEHFNDPHYGSPIGDIAVDPENEDRIWVCMGGYSATSGTFYSQSAGDHKVWHSDNGGASWQDWDPLGSLPLFPANSIVYQKGSNDRLYVGTDIGVFYKDATMACWEYFGNDQHGFQVRELAINNCTGTLYAATWGSGLWAAPVLPYTEDYVVSNDEQWDNDKFFSTNLVIKSGVTLRLNYMELEMAEDKKIIVEKGARLIAGNSIITSSKCDNTWGGIEVYGAGNDISHPERLLVTSGQYPSNSNHHGVVDLYACRLENATTAISLARFDENLEGESYYNLEEGAGGIVIANQTSFYNNRRDVEFMKFDFSNISTFQRCTFATNNDYKFGEAQIPNHITMWAVHDVRILACEFRNERTSVASMEEAAGVGIFTIDAAYIARAICDSVDANGDCIDNGDTSVRPNVFSSLNRGILAENTCPANYGSLQINKNVFENVNRSIMLRGTDDAVIVRNEITHDENGFYGVDLECFNGVTYTENLIENQLLGTINTSMGILPNQIYKNEIQNNTVYGLAPFQNCQNFQMRCNEFDNNGWSGDIYLPTDVSILGQGSNERPASNTFGVTQPSTGAVDGAIFKSASSDLFVGYWHYDEDNHTPEYTSDGVVLIPSNVTFIQSEHCLRLNLSDILVNKVEENPSINTDAYYSLLDKLEEDDPDRWQLINTIMVAHLVEHRPNKIEQLLISEANPWLEVKLASYYTQGKRYTEADNLLEKMAQNENNSISEVSKFLLIKNDLESKDKTWFDMTDNQLNIVSDFAKADNYMPANVYARSVLHLTKDIFFEEALPEVEKDYPSEEEEKPIFTIYPNPIVGQLHLHYTGTIEEGFTVTIFELIKNTQVHEGKMEGDPYVLDVSHWETGFYSIQVYDTDNQLLFKSKTQIKN